MHTLLFYLNDNKNRDHTLGFFLFSFASLLFFWVCGSKHLIDFNIWRNVQGMNRQNPNDSSKYWKTRVLKWIHTRPQTSDEQNQQLLRIPPRDLGTRWWQLLIPPSTISSPQLLIPPSTIFSPQLRLFCNLKYQFSENTISQRRKQIKTTRGSKREQTRSRILRAWHWNGRENRGHPRISLGENNKTWVSVK